MYGTTARYSYGNIAQENLAISARGDRIAGFYELPPELSAQFTSLGRAQPAPQAAPIWGGGGRESIFRGAINFDELGAWYSIPWAGGR